MNDPKTSYLYGQIVKDIEDNIWGGYRTDKPYLIQSAILTSNKGTDYDFNLEADRFFLPTPNDKYIVYTIGRFDPYRLGVKTKVGRWYNGLELNTDGLILKFFYDTYLVDPAKVMFYQDYDYSIYFAVKVEDYPQHILRNVRLIVNSYLNVDDQAYGSTAEPIVMSSSNSTYAELKAFEGGFVTGANGNKFISPEYQVYVNGALLLNGTINETQFIQDFGGDINNIEIVIYKDETFLGSKRLFNSNQIVNYYNLIGDNKYWIKEAGEEKERIVSVDNNCIINTDDLDLSRKFFYKLDCEFYLVGKGKVSYLQYGVPIFPYTDYNEIRNITYTDFGISVRLVDETRRRAMLDFNGDLILNQDDPITGKIRVNDLKNKIKSDSSFLDNLSELPIYRDTTDFDRRDLIMRAPDGTGWGDLGRNNPTLKTINLNHKDLGNVQQNPKYFLNQYKPYSYFGIMESIAEPKLDRDGNYLQPLMSSLFGYSSNIKTTLVGSTDIIHSVNLNTGPILKNGDAVIADTATDKIKENLPIRVSKSLQDFAKHSVHNGFASEYQDQFFLLSDLRKGTPDWVKADTNDYKVDLNTNRITWLGTFANDAVYNKLIINNNDYLTVSQDISINTTSALRQCLDDSYSDKVKGIRVDFSEVTSDTDREYHTFPTYTPRDKEYEPHFIAKWNDIQVYLKSGQRLIPGLDFVFHDQTVYLTNLEYLQDGSDNTVHVLAGDFDFYHKDREFPKFTPKIRTGWIKDEFFFHSSNDDYFFFLSTYSDLFINGDKIDEEMIRGANEIRIRDLGRKYNGKPFMIVPKRPYLKSSFLLDICGQTEHQAYQKLEKLNTFTENMIKRPVPQSAQVINGKYGIVSLTIQTLINDLLSYRLNIDHNVLTNAGAGIYFNNDRYKTLLDIDPARNRDDLQYVEIYPTFYEAIELKLAQYRFLEMVNNTYFNGVINLSASLSIKP